jgi:hypothetical protein
MMRLWSRKSSDLKLLNLISANNTQVIAYVKAYERLKPIGYSQVHVVEALKAYGGGAAGLSPQEEDQQHQRYEVTRVGSHDTQHTTHTHNTHTAHTYAALSAGCWPS